MIFTTCNWFFFFQICCFKYFKVCFSHSLSHKVFKVSRISEKRWKKVIKILSYPGPRSGFSDRDIGQEPLSKSKTHIYNKKKVFGFQRKACHKSSTWFIPLKLEYAGSRYTVIKIQEKKWICYHKAAFISERSFTFFPEFHTAKSFQLWLTFTWMNNMKTTFWFFLSIKFLKKKLGKVKTMDIIYLFTIYQI